jgi:hypothetical protein
LIIDDNSLSMANTQRKMAKRFSSFMSYIQDVDYHIGITTTDVSQGRYGIKGDLLNYFGTSLKVLTPRTPDAKSLFINTIYRRETLYCEKVRDSRYCPSGYEEPLTATILAMDKKSWQNRGFFRDKVDLAVVVLSDEDESGRTRPADVVDAFRYHFGSSKRLEVHGIIIKPGDKSCLNQNPDSRYSKTINDLIQKTGGSAHSVCDQDYGKSLSNISERMRRLISSFELKNIPKPGTLKVTLSPNTNIPWKLDGKKVIFDSPPAPGTKIEISYEY